jgi:biopolymer transport protein TolR
VAALQQRSGGSRRRALAEINVVPYIDVMLVLLIIFMVTAPLITPSLVKLPTVGSASRAPDTVVEVDLHADKTLQVRLLDPKAKPGDPALQPQDVTAEALTQTVAQLASGAGGTLADMPVMIAADKRVEYDDVMKLLDRLKRAGVQRVGLAVAASGGR